MGLAGDTTMVAPAEVERMARKLPRHSRRPPGMNVKLAALLSVVIALSACAPAASLGGDVGLARADVARASADPADAVRAGTAVDAFGLDLYRAMAAGQANLVFSPASITLALAMARAGARGVTASEMDAVMHGAAADAIERRRQPLDRYERRVVNVGRENWHLPAWGELFHFFTISKLSAVSVLSAK